MKELQKGISISIVTFNTWDRTSACIQSVLDEYDSATVEILVHDNGSQENTREDWPDSVRVHRSENNVGFGAGHNANLDRARFDTFLILNPDVTVGRTTLEALATAVQLPGVAAAAPILVFPNGSEQLSFRRFPTLWTEYARIFGADRNPDSRWSTLVRVQQGRGVVQVEQPAAAVLAVRTEVIRSVEGFDTDFAMYFEDVDLCARLIKVGEILALSNFTAIHDGEGTAKKYRTATTFWIENSRRRYHRKFATGLSLQLISIAISLSGFTHFAATACKAALCSGPKREMLSAKSRGYRSALVATVAGSDEYWREQFLKN